MTPPKGEAFDGAVRQGATIGGDPFGGSVPFQEGGLPADDTSRDVYEGLPGDACLSMMPLTESEGQAASGAETEAARASILNKLDPTLEALVKVLTNKGWNSGEILSLFQHAVGHYDPETERRRRIGEEVDAGMAVLDARREAEQQHRLLHAWEEDQRMAIAGRTEMECVTEEGPDTLVDTRVQPREVSMDDVAPNGGDESAQRDSPADEGAPDHVAGEANKQDKPRLPRLDSGDLYDVVAAVHEIMQRGGMLPNDPIPGGMGTKDTTNQVPAVNPTTAESIDPSQQGVGQGAPETAEADDGLDTLREVNGGKQKKYASLGALLVFVGLVGVPSYSAFSGSGEEEPGDTPEVAALLEKDSSLGDDDTQADTPESTEPNMAANEPGQQSQSEDEPQLDEVSTNSIRARTIEDIFPGIDTVREEVTRFRGCIDMAIDWRDDVDFSKTPRTFLVAAVYAAQEYASSGNLGNRAPLAPETMQGLYGLNPEDIEDIYQGYAPGDVRERVAEHFEQLTPTEQNTIRSVKETFAFLHEFIPVVNREMTEWQDRLIEEGQYITEIETGEKILDAPQEDIENQMIRAIGIGIGEVYQETDRIAGGPDGDGYVPGIFRGFRSGDNAVLDGVRTEEVELRAKEAANYPVDCS